MSEMHGNPGDAAGDRQHWKLVVADDIPLNADSLSDVLRMMGHDVLTVYDGTTAVAAHTSFVPDAYLLDLDMPVMDGYDTCRAIRRLPGGESVTIVALSGWGRHEDLADARESGFSGFLLKPADPRDILLSLSAHQSKKAPPEPQSPA